MIQNTEGIDALARLVKYCEAEASGLNLSFVAYCLSLANGAIEEECANEDVKNLKEA